VRIATVSVNVSISRAMASQGPTFCAIVVMGGRILPAMSSWNVETAKICTARLAATLHLAQDLDAEDHFAVPASAKTVCATNADTHHTLTRSTKCRTRAGRKPWKSPVISVRAITRLDEELARGLQLVMLTHRIEPVLWKIPYRLLTYGLQDKKTV
jgi:hypothetical protein